MMDHSADKQTHTSLDNKIRTLQEHRVFTEYVLRHTMHLDAYVHVMLQDSALWVNSMSGNLHKKDHSGPIVGDQAGKKTTVMPSQVVWEMQQCQVLFTS